VETLALQEGKKSYAHYALSGIRIQCSSSQRPCCYSNIYYYM